MSRARDVAKRRRRAIWEAAIDALYDDAVAEIQPLQPRLPREVLVAEALGYFPGRLRAADGYLSPNLAPPKEYMRARLLGAGDGALERERLAADVSQLRGGGTRMGLGSLHGRPRRSEEAGRKRRLQRRT
jgi:hypothetical protein